MLYLKKESIPAKNEFIWLELSYIEVYNIYITFWPYITHLKY